MTAALPAPNAPLLLAAPRYVDSVWCMDAIDWCNMLPPQSVDMILCDPPYGTTACTWDAVIPFEPMWRAFKRVIKPKGAIVMTASQPFTTRLALSNWGWFRYEWIWVKSQGTGYLNANRNPMKAHENVLVFYEALGIYSPQMERGNAYRATSGAVGGFVRDKSVGGYLTINDGLRYPKSTLFFNGEMGLHPTQKPVSLFSYLVKTYTRPGDLVCDPTCGSGTTAVAARNTGRRYVVNDNDPHWYGVTCKRLAMPYTLPLFTDAPAPQPATVQEALW